MTPNATLLAYSQPNNVRQIRDQATLISMAWRDHMEKYGIRQSASEGESSPVEKASVKDGMLETLTVELESGNVLVRAIQPQLLLVLVGGSFTGFQGDATQDCRITPEIKGSPSYPAADWQPLDMLASSPASVREIPEGMKQQQPVSNIKVVQQEEQPAEVSEAEREIRTAILKLQRDKIAAACEHMRRDFSQRGFIMPEDSNGP